MKRADPPSESDDAKKACDSDSSKHEQFIKAISDSFNSYSLEEASRPASGCETKRARKVSLSSDSSDL